MVEREAERMTPPVSEPRGDRHRTLAARIEEALSPSKGNYME